MADIQTKLAKQPAKGTSRCQYEQSQTSQTPLNVYDNTEKGKTYQRGIMIKDKK